MAGKNKKQDIQSFNPSQFFMTIPIVSMVMLVIILTGCPSQKCVEEDYGLLEESHRLLIPYRNGEVYYFRHSGGKIIPFAATRQVKSKTEEEYPKFSCYRYTYELDVTVLEPDYPIPPISLSVSSYERDYKNVSINLGNSYFEYSQSSYYPPAIQDTLWIDSIPYTEVIVLRSYNWQNSTHYADSLYYNTDHGILKILMNYGEYYTLYK